jgi:hypothetical protein
MNAEQQATPDPPAKPEAEAEADPEAVDTDSELLRRSREVIDEGHNAAREALQDGPSEAESSEPNG